MKLTTVCALVLFTLAAIAAPAQVTTSQYNNMRTGATLHENALTPTNVNPKQFGKLGAFKVDGAVYAQPLFLPSVEIPGKGTHSWADPRAITKKFLRSAFVNRPFPSAKFVAMERAARFNWSARK